MYKSFFNRILTGISAIVLLSFIAGCSGRVEFPEEIEAQLPEKIDFNYHIKPILSDRCFVCHGPDENKREAGLRLDIRDSAYYR